MTVVAAELVVHDVPAKPGAKPTALTTAAKMNPGRAVQRPNVGGTMGRAKVVVKRVVPKSWAGNLEVAVWDVTANSHADPRLGLLADGNPPAIAHANPIVHGAGFSKKGLTLWAEGLLTSSALRHTELRLRVEDAEGTADHAAATVHEFFVKEVFFDAVVPLYYARIPHAGSYLLPPVADPVRTHFSPAEERPAVGTPHWQRQAGANPAALFSWPAIYGRQKASGVPAPTLRASFELFPKVAGNMTAASGPMAVRQEW